MPENGICPPAAWVARLRNHGIGIVTHDFRSFLRERQVTTSASLNNPIRATISLLSNDAREGREVPEDTCPPMARVAAHRPHAW